MPPTENNNLESQIVVFVSYSQDSEAHQDRVLDLADRLREDGFETILDQYIRTPPQNWVAWMDKSMKSAKFVLIVYSKEYSSKSERFERSGAGWESIVMSGELSFGPREYAKYIPIFFDEVDRSWLPSSLQNASRYVLDQDYGELCAHLSGQSRADRRRVKTLQSRPPLSRKTDFIRPWYVPLNRDPLFKGSDELLARIHESTSARTISVIESNPLSPVSGPELALEYAYRHKQDYSAVFWLAGSAEHLQQAYAQIARMPGLQEPLPETESRLQSALLRWLRAKRDWLLILEGSPQSERVADFFPLAERGSIIVCAPKGAKPWPARSSIVSLVEPVDESIDELTAPIALRDGGAIRTPKIFLSYRKSETLKIATQLASALSESGFSVMQERFSLPPGVDFQALLMGELGETDLLVVIESQNSSTSAWISFEVGYAKTHRIGLAAINLAGGKRFPEIADDKRVFSTHFDIDEDGRFVPAKLSACADFVWREYKQAQEQRLRRLQSDLEAALSLSGLRETHWNAGGRLEVQRAGNSAALIAVQATSPTPYDIYQLHRSSAPGRALHLLSPEAFMLPDARDMVQWVARLADVRLLDDRQLMSFATELAGGQRSRDTGSRLRGRRILVSASTPSAARGGAADGTEDAAKLAIAALTKAIVAEDGRIVMAGHPNVFRTVMDAAAELVQTVDRDAQDTPIHVYLTRYYKSAAENEDLQFAYRQGIATLNWVETVPNEARASMRRLRTVMIAESNPLAMVCIGGEEGLLEELHIFRSTHPNAPIFAFETTGGAAARVAGEQLAGAYVIDRELARRFDTAEAGYFPYSIVMEVLVDEFAALAGANARSHWS